MAQTQQTDATPATRHSLFFALLPPPELAERMAATAAQLRTGLGLTGRPMEAQRLHLTLLWAAPEASASTIDAMCALAQRVAMPPVAVVLDRLGRFERRPRQPAPVVLLSSDPSTMPALRALQRRLQDAVLAAGFPARAVTRFQPHVTLLHDRRPVPAQPAGPFAWTAHEFVLIHSHVGLRRYDIVGRWPLRGATA